MNTHYIEIAFWSAFGIIFYSFLGYGIVLYILVKIKRIASPAKKKLNSSFEPEVTLVIPCFNEADILADKIANSKKLDYPSEKLSIVFITDGSDDNSVEILHQWPEIEVLH